VTVIALIEIVVALAVLQAGPNGLVQSLLFLLSAMGVIVAARSYFVRRGLWTAARLKMTHELIEKMVGHRTRLAQELSDRRHDGGDESLCHYSELSVAMDHIAVFLGWSVGRVWLVLGLLGLAPIFVAGNAGTARLAVGLAGILLGVRAIEKLTLGVS